VDDHGELATLRHRLKTELERRGASRRDTHDVMLAAHEATKNALSCSGVRPAYVTTHFMFGGVIVCVADGGRGFNLAGRHRDAFPGPEQPAEQPGAAP
jgi:hypothetical protein